MIKPRQRLIREKPSPLAVPTGINRKRTRSPVLPTELPPIRSQRDQLNSAIFHILQLNAAHA